MSSARITGLIASLVFAALLVWVVMLTFNQDGTVLPSVRVEPRAGVAANPRPPNRCSPSALGCKRSARWRAGPRPRSSP